MQLPKSNAFIFSSRYRLWRHIVFWSLHTVIWAAFWVLMGIPIPFERQLLYMALWTPGFILFSYPLIYVAIPYLLLKGKVLQFFLAILAWGAIGLYIDEAYRAYIIIPFQQYLGLDRPIPSGPLASCYLCMTTSVAGPMTLRFFKLWSIKQRAWMQAHQEKITAELQLLKAQVHPHFLFNTLNNIYSFSMENSPKTPELILKLSSLLSYILNDCKTAEARLEKEIEIMKNYIDLERERYGSKIAISWNVEGDISDKFIAPLLMLPFLENAFKHGASEQIEKSWVSVDISVQENVLRCKISNSKNEYVPYSEKGIGISNVKKRLTFIYPGNHKLKLNDEGRYFVVAMVVNISSKVEMPGLYVSAPLIAQDGHKATLLPAYE